MGPREWWAWETCVEDAALRLGYDDALSRPEVVTAIAARFQQRFPYNQQIPENKAIWRRIAMQIDSTATDIVQYVGEQFSKLLSSGGEISSERAHSILHSRLDPVEELTRTHLRDLVDCPFYVFPQDQRQIPHQTGIYALWRGKHHGSLTYVGESGDKSLGIVKRWLSYLAGGKHPWWGRPSMVVTFCVAPELRERKLRLATEKRAIAALQPSSQFVARTVVGR